MKIFVLNRGSSSIKCALYSFDTLPETTQPAIWEKEIDELEEIKELWKDQEAPDVIGHRVVHGGQIYKKGVLIDDTVKKTIRSLATLAPLHNLANLEGIEFLEAIFPGKRHVAIFDTAFHQTMPMKAKVYPGPHEWIEKGVLRYGFHGISFQYCYRRAIEMKGQISKAILCHLGSGASLCAVYEGKSIDTTMGFTPLEGLMMNTRSGSIDPGIIFYLMKQEGKTAEGIEQMLYKKSGLLGLSTVSADIRDLLTHKEGYAELALEVYFHRIYALIGAMVASLQGIDLLLFTGGIGEHQPFVRERICNHFSFLGITLDKGKNEESGKEDREISSAHSKVNVLLVHTEESFEIARESYTLCL